MEDDVSRSVRHGRRAVRRRARAPPRRERPERDWPAIVEKAYAQYAGGYGKIANGGLPTDALAVLTGQEATYHSLGWLDRLFGLYKGDYLRADLANGKIVVLSTRAAFGGQGRPAPANDGPSPTPMGSSPGTRTS